MRYSMLLLISSGLACGAEGVHRLDDGCANGEVTMTVTGPPTYTCMQAFTSTIVLTNNTCNAISVTDGAVTGTVTDGSCTPPPPGTAHNVSKSVAAGATTTVVDFKGNDFCCLPGACPTPFQCD